MSVGPQWSPRLILLLGQRRRGEPCSSGVHLQQNSILATNTYVPSSGIGIEWRLGKDKTRGSGRLYSLTVPVTLVTTVILPHY